MKKCRHVIVFLRISIVLGACCAAGAVEEVSGSWSEVHEHLKARFHLKHRLVTDNQSEILVYLEFGNTCPPEGTAKVKFPFSTVGNLSFTVKDSEGDEVKTGPVFCSTFYDSKPFELTLPQDCTIQFCISQNGGGVHQDRALLYLVPGQGWYFKHGEGETYELSATLSVAQSERFEERHWAGELELPPVRIPVPQGGREPGDAAEKTEN